MQCYLNWLRATGQAAYPELPSPGLQSRALKSGTTALQPSEDAAFTLNQGYGTTLAVCEGFQMHVFKTGHNFYCL